jgi:prepilin-type N-terminal cleavage/methylation domain-containing protein
MHRDRGFSLIEVLVAVVILSVGLLALASLQLSLIRSSSGTKAQSIAMALAKEKLEQLASYKAMGGADSACVSPTAGGADTCYRAITGETLAAVDVDPVATGTQSEVGGVSYSRGTTVTRYVFDKAATSAPKYFSVSNIALDSAIKALSGHTYLPGKEFKRIVVTVRWADSAGITQQVIVEDAISGLEPSDTVAVSKNEGGGDARKAVAIIVNPASVAGVIPIAVGNGSDTAATNPRPILLSQGSSTTLVETRFDIYTYAALSGSTAQAQSRVETSVIGCSCTTSGGTQAAFRPTFWNGSRYIAPDTATGIPVSAPKNNVDQSTLCTSCCRDHHDPGSVTGEKFDPRRSAHNHYSDSNLSSLVDMTSSGNDYDDACRLIRVDGIFRVAAEPYNDYFGLVATAGLNQSTGTTTVAGAVPGSTQTSYYQNYVLDYLQARFIDGAESGYNTPLNPSSVAGASALDAPATAGIATASTPQYLHSRGLFIDFLTDDVKTLVTNAKNPANCPGTDNLPADTAAELQACVFKLLPFTSINLTELASWSSTFPEKVEVTNLDFKSTVDAQLPVKGKAVLKGGVSPDEIDGRANIQRTSAGLAVTQKVFPDSELPTVNTISNVLTDANNQHFLVGTVATPPSNELFYVLLSGSDMLSGVAYGAGNAPQVGFSLSSSACNGDENTGGDMTVLSDINKILGDDNGAKPDEFRCVPDSGQSLGGSVNVDVSNYNRKIATQVTVGNACTNPIDTTTMPYSKDYDVTGAALIAYTVPGVDANGDGDYDDAGDTLPVTTSTALGSGTAFNIDQPGDLFVNGEYTRLVVNPLLTGQRIEVTFGTFTYRCPSNWATYITNTGAELSFSTAQRNDNALCGSGADKGPQWSSTYAACPTGFAPFLP